MSRLTSSERRDEIYACELTDEEIQAEIIGLLKHWDFFLDQVSCRTDNWICDHSNHSLTDIVIRVEKRKTYYKYFHNMDISLRKRAGLFAYWIVKLRPFTIVFEDKEKTSDTEREMAAEINEHFAAYYIYACLSYESKMSTSKTSKISRKCKRSYHEALIYSLRFRNINIDSMMLLMETIDASSLDRIITRR